MNATVSILAEIPEELHETLKGYLEAHPDWDQDRVFTAAHIKRWFSELGKKKEKEFRKSAWEYGAKLDFLGQSLRTCRRAPERRLQRRG